MLSSLEEWYVRRYIPSRQKLRRQSVRGTGGVHRKPLGLIVFSAQNETLYSCPTLALLLPDACANSRSLMPRGVSLWCEDEKTSDQRSNTIIVTKFYKGTSSIERNIVFFIFFLREWMEKPDRLQFPLFIPIDIDIPFV